jgi:ABC-type multidrug transport system ATPase subunit
LLDEATASVDPENEALIQNGINALVESKTLIIIAHRLSSITAANHILVLNRQGTIEESGTHRELLEGGGFTPRSGRAAAKASNGPSTIGDRRAAAGGAAPFPGGGLAVVHDNEIHYPSKKQPGSLAGNVLCLYFLKHRMKCSFLMRQATGKNARMHRRKA